LLPPWETVEKTHVCDVAVNFRKIARSHDGNKDKYILALPSSVVDGGDEE
jgi:hypothetical protein